MKKNTLVTISYIFSLFLISCGGNNSNSSSVDSKKTVADTPAAVASYDLSDKGIPTSIEGPAGAKVRKGMSGGEIDGVKTTSLSISKDMFKLEVNMDSEASGRTLEELVTYYKELWQDEKGFEIVKEDANGFIYKTTDDGETNYSFDYIKMNEKGIALEITTGFALSNFTQEDIEKMYQAAQKATWK